MTERRPDLRPDWWPNADDAWGHRPNLSDPGYAKSPDHGAAWADLHAHRGRLPIVLAAALGAIFGAAFLMFWVWALT